MKKQILNEEFLRMQKLAGILTEEFNSKTFKWKNSPKNPNDMVEILDIGDDEDEDPNKELMSKKDFWNGNIIGISREESIPAYGEFKNGSWAFIWDDGDVEISGFKEGEDFTL
jgi:hypothetical protein